LPGSYSDIIQEVLKGNQNCIGDLYKLYRNDFIRWAKHNFGANEELAKDVFQETLLDFYQNIISGRLTDLTSSLKTYLFQLGKYKLINALKKEGRVTYHDDLSLIHGKEHDQFMKSENECYSGEEIKAAIAKLSADEQKVLKLYYFSEYDMESIAREMGYKNADTAKSKKSLCMKKLIVELKKISMLFFI
jgi:RNA polymerase sigma factor (sigma-70 family)